MDGLYNLITDLDGSKLDGHNVRNSWLDVVMKRPTDNISSQLKPRDNLSVITHSEDFRRN